MEDTTKYIKTSWEEVTLAEFIELGKIEANLELEGLFLSKRVKQMVVISNISEDELLNMSAEAFNELVDLSKFLDTEAEGNFDEFEIDGVTYAYVNPSKMTAGEVISIETIVKQGVDNKVNSLSKQLAIMIRPKGEEFDVAKIEERSKLFEERLTVPNFIKLLTVSTES